MKTMPSVLRFFSAQSVVTRTSWRLMWSSPLRCEFPDPWPGPGIGWSVRASGGREGSAGGVDAGGAEAGRGRKDSVRATQAATDAAQINRASFRQQPAPVVAGSELLIGKALLRYVSGRGSPVVG